jgi:hypothetical protein
VNRTIASALFAATLVLPFASTSQAARVRIRTNSVRVHVNVHAGFPIRRVLPEVIVRPAGVIRVEPRAYIAPIAFREVIVTAPRPERRVWTASESLARGDGWTDFTLDVDRRGSGLLLQVDRGAARISFAEVVFENGETQVVDFNDRVERRGTYSLLDFRDGRKVDHVRVVASAAGRQADLRLHLIS